MRFDEMSPELVEKAKKCETREERMAFIAENGLELTDEQLESIAGGRDRLMAKLKKSTCPNSEDGSHDWELTGRTRPSENFGNSWPDQEKRCKRCGLTIGCLVT